MLINYIFNLISHFWYDAVFFDTLKWCNYCASHGIKLELIGLFAGISSIFFTFKARFFNFRFIPHLISILKNEMRSKVNAPGSVSFLSSITTAASGSVGIGTIVGAQIAIERGGPGAVFWMLFMGIVISILKFTEVIIAHKTRKIDETGEVEKCGPAVYISMAFSKIKLPKFGKYAVFIHILLLLFVSYTSADPFQSNQVTAIIHNTFPYFKQHSWIIPILLTAFITPFILGGLKKIVQASNWFTPLMGLSYIVVLLCIAIVWHDNLVNALICIMKDALSLKAIGIGGGGSLIVIAIVRVIFSSESGTGSTTIVYSRTKSQSPTHVGFSTFIESSLNIFVFTITGYIIVLTGVYQHPGMHGIVVIQEAFSNTFPWLGVALTGIIFIFGISTAISWSYYGLNSWQYIFKSQSRFSKLIFSCTYIACFYLGCIVQDLNKLVLVCDAVWMSTIFINMTSVFILRKIAFSEVDNYLKSK